MATLAGIEIGGTKLQLVLGDETGAIHDRRRLNVDASRGAGHLRGQIEAALAALIGGRPLAGAGVGFGGPVDWRTGLICCSHHVEGWSEFQIKGWLEQLVKAPVFVENDANVAALGEAVHGAGAGCDPVFYVTLGSGVGGGLVAGRRIYHGAVPGEAEIGHVRLDRSGATVESRCAGWSVDRRIRALRVSEPASALAQMLDATPGGEARHLVAALQAGDGAAQRILAEVAEDLAFGLSHVVHLFHPEVIILGGGLAKVGEPLVRAVAAALPRWTMEAFAPGPRVCLSRLQEDAVPVGALQLAAGGLAGKSL